jgi:hypothetical protein
MQLLIRHTRGATIDRYQAHALLRRLYCEAVPDVNMHCGLREIDSMKLDAGHRFREWLYDEALITGIVLAICFPLMLLAVAISGREQGADQRDVQLGRQLWPKRVAHPVAQYRDHI